MSTKKYDNAAERDAYNRGLVWGRGFAAHNVPTIGDTVFSDGLGRVTVDAENIREIHVSECYSAESNARSFSPFEFTAAEFNTSDDSEALWEAFEAGTHASIAAELEAFTDANYGIEESSHVSIKTYEIRNTRSGVSLGQFEASSESDALDALARAAGYPTHAAACEVAPVAADELSVTLVDAPEATP